MRFINPSTNKPLTPQPPTVKNWIKTIRSKFKMSSKFSKIISNLLIHIGFQNIFKMLNENGIKVLLPRHCNQDPLENFFGAIPTSYWIS